jgi:AraC family transcriptional activator of pyochelin receptor
VDRPALAITPAMRATVNSLWNNPLKGPLTGLYMETKMMELLSQQWELFPHSRTPAPIIRNKEDMEKMQLAKEFLVRDLQHPPSLAELARLCGTNEFKLKKVFKEVFNETVFGYFNSVRLEEARLLILDTDKTITVIADEMGYAHPQHFTRAFKQRFGVAPGKLRK